MTTDRIERDILIDAPLERVWSLVTEPGWWVGGRAADEPSAHEGQQVVMHEGSGDYPVRVETVRPREYVAYRWACAFPDQQLRDDNTTLVEFTLTGEDGKTRLRVVESGFASLAAPDDLRDKQFRDNTHGWSVELGGLRERAEKPAA